MASSCPYCGAALKLKFCVVCGRQSKLNKMGHLRNTARNTDATTRLEDPFLTDESQPNKTLRFKRTIDPRLLATLGILAAGILMFCAAQVALTLHATGELGRVIMPWMKTHHINFPNGWPKELSILRKYMPLDVQKDTKVKRQGNKAVLHGRSDGKRVK